MTFHLSVEMLIFFIYTENSNKGDRGFMFGDKIKQFRIDNNYSQSEIAKKLNVTTRTIVRWEQNKNTPNSSELKKIANLVGMTEEELVSEVEDVRINSFISNKVSILEKISDGVDNLISENSQNHEELINSLKEQNRILLERLDEQAKAIDIDKTELIHKRIRTVVVCVTCVIVLIMVFVAWWYWINFGFGGEIVAGPVIEGEASYFEYYD